MGKYLVVGQHSWSKSAFNKNTMYDNDTWSYFDGGPNVLNDYIVEISPEKIFFTHWSHFVPASITDNYECICFHPSHLPYGRGGTPIQNLIDRGVMQTRLTAFKMTQELDAGPIYLQYPLSLEGTAQEIYERIAEISWRMIRHILKDNVCPIQQVGEVVTFRRRTPEQSEIFDGNMPLVKFYDHIRMLSAENYPHAFIEYDHKIIEFFDPELHENFISARVIIHEAQND